MVELDEAQLSSIFQALSDTTRRAMLRDLVAGERTVSQLAKPHEMSLAAASKHIKALENAGLITREVQWRTHLCRLNAEPLSAAQRWLNHYTRFWNDRLDVLEQMLLTDDAAQDSQQKETPQ